MDSSATVISICPVKLILDGMLPLSMPMISSVVVTLTAPGGKETCAPVSTFNELNENAASANDVVFAVGLKCIEAPFWTMRSVTP